MLVTNRILYAEAGEGTTGGGGGSILTAPSGGSAGSVPEGNKTSGNPPSAEGSTLGNNSAGSNQAGGQNTDWKSALPKELQDEPSLKSINDINALAKSYINAQKLVGAEKIVVPSKHATPEDWKGVYQKLGLPADIKEYDIKLKEGALVDKDFSEKFKQTAYNAGILPQQAQTLVEWYDKANQEIETTIQTKLKAQQDTQIAQLKEEWGQAFDQKVSRAKQVLGEVQDKSLIEYLDQSGLGNDPKLIKMFAQIGDRFFKEATEKGGQSPNSNLQSPAEARAEYNKAMADQSHPYWVKDHPGHNDAVKEMARLFNMANPAKS